jgi:predicted acyltransferase
MDTKGRLISVDVFRGLTICFMIMVNTPGSWEYVYAPMRHAEWHGWTPTDMVFPFFLTTVGISMALSMSNRQGNQSQMLMKVFKRAAAIFLVGLLLNWFPFYTKNIADLRIWGVLQRIAASYFIAGVVVIYLKEWNKLLIYAIGALLAYWALLYFGGDYSLEGNFNNIVDRAMLADSHIYKGFGIPFDPEGILGALSGSAHVIIGYLFSKKLLSKPIDYAYSIKYALIAGAGLVTLAYIWNIAFPINKPLWTSSYVCLACGLAFIFYALLLYIIDVKGFTKWAYPFQVFGLNPLASYALSGIMVRVLSMFVKIGDKNAMGFLYSDVFTPVFGPLNGSLVFAIFFTFLIWIFAFILYRKNIVVKL